MSQFGGSPRDQDYGFFTTPARTAVSTSQFGSTAVQTKPAPRPLAPSPGPDERPPPAFGLPAPAHRATPERSRPRLVLPLALLLLVGFVTGAAFAYLNGFIPGVNQPASEEPLLVSQPMSGYVVAAPDQVLGWQRDTGAKAQEIDAMLSGLDALPVEATTFVYVDGKGRPTMYGAAFVEPLTKAEQREYLADVTQGLRSSAPVGSVGAFSDRPAGQWGGFFRCASLRTEPGGTTCVFTTKDTSGVLTVRGQTGQAAVDDVRAAREALITRR